MKPRLVIAFAAASTCLMAGPLAAQPVEPGEERQIVDLLPPVAGARVCFARDYDEAHLKAHPDQRVRSIGLRIAYYAHDPDQYYPKGQRNYYFELSTVLREDGRELTADGECVPAPDGRNIWCGVDCDGGVSIRRAATNGAVLVDLEATGRIRMSEGCDDEAGMDLEPGSDDKVFLLSKVPSSSCPAYDDW